MFSGIYATAPNLPRFDVALLVVFVLVVLIVVVFVRIVVLIVVVFIRIVEFVGGKEVVGHGTHEVGSAAGLAALVSNWVE
jgi:type IV secretory pathway TrbL component